MSAARLWPPGSRTLLAMFLLNSLALNLLIGQITHDRTALFYAARILTPTRLSANDSWRPMQAALRFLDEHPGAPVYQAVFFDQQIKFQYPPTSLLPFKALESLSIPMDAVTLNECSRAAVFAVAALVIVILRRSLRQWMPAGPTSAAGVWIWTALGVGFTFAFFPFAMGFYEGQIQTWVTLLFAGAVLAWMCGRMTLAGALCAGMAAIKPQWALMLPWALVRRQWRFARGMLVPLAAMVAASIWIFGLASHVDYFRALHMMAQRGEIFYANQSVNGVLNRWIFGSCFAGSTYFAPYHPVVYAATIVTSLAIAGAAIVVGAGTRAQPGAIDLSIAALSFTMASPIAWEQHYGIMLPIFAAVVPVALSRRAGTPALWLLAAAFVLSSNDAIVPGCPSRLMNLAQSHLFAGAVLATVCLYGMRRALLGPVRP